MVPELSTTPASPDMATWLELLRRGLENDPDLADAFERTPGKVAHRLGIPYAQVSEVLARFTSPAGSPDSSDRNAFAAAKPRVPPVPLQRDLRERT